MGEAKEALLHSCTVYLYRYDAQQGSYAQQTDSALGCALLGATRASEDDASASAAAATTFKLLLYNAQKQPVLQMPVATSTRFTPQSDSYVHFYDAEQQNYSMRFRDASESAAFLAAAAFVHAHVVVHSSRYFKASRGDRLAVSVDDIATGKADAAGLAHGDVAGVAIQRWQGSADSRSSFFTPNPLEIPKQPAVEATSGSGNDVKRIRLVPYDASTESDLLTRALAAEALVDMQKNARRLVTVVSASTQEWFIAQIELVKVKKATRSSVSAPAAADESESKGVDEEVKEVEPSVGDGGDEHAELIKRMASISRAGSQSSGLIASLSSRLASRKDSVEQPTFAEPDPAERQGSSFAEQSAPPAGYVPVLLAGLQLPGERANSLSRANTSSSEQPLIAANDASSATSSFATPSSLAGKVIAPLKQSPRGSAAISTELSDNDAASFALSTEMEQLMKEQSDLEKLRLELEESKKKLQSEDLSTPASSATFPGGSSPSSVPPASTSSSYKPWEKPGLIPTPFEQSSFSNGTPSLSGTTAAASSAASSSSRWTPSNFELVPSFSPTSFVPSSSLPPPPVPFASAMTPYGSRTLGGASPFGGGATSNLSGEVENGISRLQRSSTSIESKLDDLQSKMDRLMNMQSSLKASKYSTGAGVFSSSSSGLGSSSSSVGGGASTSSSSLIKNLEKALSQRDQLQELNARLQDSVGQLESTVEDLQSQHESLQLENRNLLDKLQNGNQLQQDKFRLELRNLQQQLSHTQEQMLMYQEENFHLRNELAAKDEQLVKEKARLQDDARKQLEQLQRQLQEQVQHDSRDALRSVTAEKKALESQLADATAQKQEWQQERESLMNQLRQAQTQQQQIQTEKARSQADQDSRVRELETQLQQALGDSKTAKLQADRFAGESQHLEELLMAKEEEIAQMQTAKNEQEYAALSELLKEFMNDIYFHFQDAFDEDAEFTGKEIVMAIRKILKQNTMDILSRLEEFWQLQGHDSGHH